uniref:CUB domain-containing protein n=1 Tax=Trichobilharzia regenti TaxID=157069 RepID=A0AA85JZE5_TRIRE|nr:unnamed protein product [Trichobilharzia regenti]
MSIDLSIYVMMAIICMDSLVCSDNYSPPNMLCPSGYWPANVNISGGPYRTDRTFELPYLQDADEPICQFCPNVGCFIVRLSTDVKETRSTQSTSSTVTTSTSTTSSTSTTMTTTPTASATSSVTDTSGTTITGTSTELLLTTMNNATEINNLNETQEPVNSTLINNDDSTTRDALYMSCDHWDQLPSPSDIVSYLDCVMIGHRKQFYLFIYEPRFGIKPLPAVDCVDADFLAWIPNGTELLGLELGFRMKKIPPFLFRYHQRIMQSTQYICIDGSSLTNNSFQFEDTERFASNKLTQVVFRTSTSLRRERLPPKALDSHHTTEFQSDEEIQACPFIVQHKPANITPNTDCQFSPGGLPTTSDKVSSHQALERCPFRRLTRNKPQQRRRKSHTGLGDEISLPPSVLSACLLIVVLLLTVGIIIAFCVINHEKLVLCRSRSSKRREREAALAQELAEKAAKEAAAASAAEAEQQQAAAAAAAAARHPIYARYGMIPPNMGGAFGAFAPRPMDLTSSSTYQTVSGGNMNMASGNMGRGNPGYGGHNM